MAINVPVNGGSFKKPKIPHGAYDANLTKLEVKSFPDKYNPGEKADRIIWTFTLAGKKDPTKTVDLDLFTSLNASLTNPKSRNCQLYKTLVGVSPDPVKDAGRDVDLEELIGLPCQVLVEDRTTADGEVYSAIKEVFPPAKQDDAAEDDGGF